MSVSIADSTQKWVVEGPYQSYSRLSVAGQTVIVCDEQTITALDAGSGRLLWRREPGAGGRFQTRIDATATTPHRFYFAEAPQGRLVGVDARSGEEVVVAQGKFNEVQWLWPQGDRLFMHLHDKDKGAGPDSEWVLAFAIPPEPQGAGATGGD